MEQYRLSPLAPETVVYQQSLKLSHGGNCYSINFAKSSNVVAFGMSLQIMIYDSELQYRNQINCRAVVRSVGYHPTTKTVYYLNSRLEVCTENGQALHKFSSSNNEQSRIAVNDKYLVVSNADGHKLSVFSFASIPSKPCSIADDGNLIRSLKFDSDGLITLDVTGVVTKYRMSVRESPQLIWKCPAIRGAYALCVDQDTGVVYVTGPDHMLYIISAGVCPFGKSNK